MTITNKTMNIITFCFIFLEIILSILVHKTSNELNDLVSISVVILANIYTLVFFNKNKIYLLTQVGLICTIIADIFLVLIEPMRQIPAMIFFSLTQICYFLRIFLNHQTQKEKILHIIVRLILLILTLIVTIIILKNKTDFLSLISMFYYTNLITNIIFAFAQANKSLFLPIGLLLFACCDFFIGLNVLENSYLTIPTDSLLYLLTNVNFNLPWIFYVPSQVLIALSLLETKRLR